MQHARRSLMLGCALEALKSKSVRDGDHLSIGTYFPKHHPNHWNSSWSQLLLKAKRNDKWIITALGQIVAAQLEHWLPCSEQYTLSYVPGRNCLTRELAKRAYSNLEHRGQIQFETLLGQASKGKSQHRCRSIQERIENVSGRYHVTCQEKTIGRNIVLIDDIVTSGATLKECSRILRDCGARSVLWIALASTVWRVH